MDPEQKGKEQASKDHPSQHQQDGGDSTKGKHEWKERPPYSIHQDNSKFDVKHEASCHCGKVKYQLSRDIPLDSKLCHCTTCQTQHGKSPPDMVSGVQLFLFSSVPRSAVLVFSGRLLGIASDATRPL